ncbi:hypothetical protein VdG1_09366 [Verticillium dahliae VDG1]|nr:hypothetical protein VdG1_09366 [Verticillium dahliae VDG1]
MIQLQQTSDPTPETYLHRAAAKRAHQLAQIPAEWRLASIPSRATIAHQLTTCCTEILFDEAFAEAQRLDDVLARTGKTVGPLHGLPVSIKDCLDIKGKDSTVGWVGLVGKPAARDSNTAHVLRKLGAVFYVKTNVPQSMMMSDSYNHVWGQCVGALNRNLISGGSSGGESTLISARGSILGVGTDIGGSIRIPAALTGLYGLSPTLSRHTYERGGPRQHIVRPVAGPLAGTLSGIETYMKAFQEGEPWKVDSQVAPIPWRSECCVIPSTKRLRIGYIIDDGVVKTQPPVERAMQETIATLKAAGHEVIEWDASSHARAYDLWEKAILSDGGLACKKLCDMSGEPLIEGMLVGKPENLLTTEQTHELLADKYEYETEYLRRWQEAEMDALIMPVVPWVGYKPWTWVKSSQYVGYTSIWNLVDWAALALPVTTASREKDGHGTAGWKAHQPRNKADEFNKSQYDIHLVDGMPVGIQVVCGKYGDEKCVAVGKVIQEQLRKGAEKESRL